MGDLASSMYPLSFINNGSAAIPAYALMKIVPDVVTDMGNLPHNYKARLLCEQYDGETGTGEFQDDTGLSRELETIAINGPFEVVDQAYGKCTFARDYPAWAYIDKFEQPNIDAGIDFSDNTTEWVGLELGPSEASWGLCAGGKGFFVLSQPEFPVDGVNGIGRVLVQQRGGGTRIVMVVSNEDTDVILPGQAGKVCVVDRTTMTFDATKEFDADTNGFSGMLFPVAAGLEPWNLAWAYAENGGYTLISGGTQSFSGFYDGSGVVPSHPGPAGSVNCEIFCSESVVENQRCFAVLRGDTPVVIATCCPPTD